MHVWRRPEEEEEKEKGRGGGERAEVEEEQDKEKVVDVQLLFNFRCFYLTKKKRSFMTNIENETNTHSYIHKERKNEKKRGIFLAEGLLWSGGAERMGEEEKKKEERRRRT